MAGEKPTLSLTLHELVYIGTVVVTIATSFIFLRSDVVLLTKDVATLQVTISKIELEQAKIQTAVSWLYNESLIRSSSQSNGNAEKLPTK